MLDGPRLANRYQGLNEASLFQGRYSMPASQWLGPVLEDLSLTNSQITIELNSATDNPLIDASIPQPWLMHRGTFKPKLLNLLWRRSSECAVDGSTSLRSIY